MKKPIKIEFVCIGNNGRSPILEEVCRDEAKKMGLNDNVQIVSSGLYVNGRHSFDILAETMKKVIDNATDIPCEKIYGDKAALIKEILATPEIEAKYENDPEFRKNFLFYFDQAYRVLKANDVVYRNDVLALHGLEHKTEQRQFPLFEERDITNKDSEGISLVFNPIDESSTGKQKDRYIITATKSLVQPAIEMAKKSVSSIMSKRKDSMHEFYEGEISAVVTSVEQFTRIPDLKGGFGKLDINFYERLYESAKQAAPIVLKKVME